ncbi:MAG: peptidase S1, partial [Mycobacterium sp.]
MTNDPRYSPPPAQPGYEATTGLPAGYSTQRNPYQTGYQQSYDWRYAQQPAQPRPQYDPYRSTGTPSSKPQKRSRAGGLVAGALAIAVVSAGIGGGVAVLAQPDQPGTSFSSTGGATPGMPAASLPVGSVEQVAAKVVPSVVKLETNLGRASEEGSGIILSTDGLI